MKRIKAFKYLLLITLFSPLLSGCLEEAFPTSGATKEQISDAGLSGLSEAISGYMTTISLSSADYYTNLGYPSLMMWRETMLQDFPIFNDLWEYFRWYNTFRYMGDYVVQQNVWTYYYRLVMRCNLLINTADPTRVDHRPDLGNAYVYRSLAYLDMIRWYEYKHTGVADLDNRAESMGIYKLTVPLVTEKTTEDESRNNPRAPFYKMYRFIMNDLDIAEDLLADTKSVSVKSKATLGVAYGMKARLWLEIASRFERYPEDLATQLEHEADADLADYAALGIHSATDCFAKAAEYARKAINEGYSPVTESQWHDVTTGFNTANQAWMLAIVMGENDDAVKAEWASFVSHLCPETIYGFAGSYAHAPRMIDAELYSHMPDADWRKLTWIDPADFNVATDAERRANFEAKYQKRTSLEYADWSQYGAYVGFKYRPGNGNGNDSNVGNDVDLPLMRVEEMYFIEAEAIAHTQGVAAGVAALETFMNTYRYTDASYACEATGMKDFTDELMVQKRIEFWGEGIIAWDYKRLEKAVVRGYAGTNYPASFRFNSYEGYVAPQLNLYITSSETNMNAALAGKGNPDPSGSLSLWTE